MFWFVLRYAVWSLSLIGLVYFKDYSPFYFINVLQTDATVFITDVWISLFDISVTLSGNTVIFEHGLKLLILDECNGLVPFILYLAGIFAYPTRYISKIKWIFIGMAILLTLNMIRIILITLVVIAYPDSFGWAHDIVGRYAIGAATLYLFYIFTTHNQTLVPHGIISNDE